jgi:hypothetical protein
MEMNDQVQASAVVASRKSSLVPVTSRQDIAVGVVMKRNVIIRSVTCSCLMLTSGAFNDALSAGTDYIVLRGRMIVNG